MFMKIFRTLLFFGTLGLCLLLSAHVRADGDSAAKKRVSSLTATISVTHDDTKLNVELNNAAPIHGAKTAYCNAMFTYKTYKMRNEQKAELFKESEVKVGSIKTWTMQWDAGEDEYPKKINLNPKTLESWHVDAACEEDAEEAKDPKSKISQSINHMGTSSATTFN